MGEDRVYGLWRRMHRARRSPLGRMIHVYLRVVYACDILPPTVIGKGTRFPHNGLGVVIHPDAIIGKDCRVCQCVTVGGRGGEGVPRIGDRVTIGANSVVLGDIAVGDGATIGAGSVVLHDVPAGCVVAGNPAKAIRNG